MATTTAPTTCTVTRATGLCGAPAVTSFTTRGGATYAECADHDVSAICAPTAPALAPGATVVVYHAGVTKTGVVLTVGRTRAKVVVPVGRGRTAGTKVITVAQADLAL